MDLLLHKIIISIFITVYMPMTLTYYIFMFKEKGWRNRFCNGLVGTALLVNLPNVIKNYQQYVMGHFSGLPEVITTRQFTADIIFVIVSVLAIGIFTCAFVSYRRD